MQNAKCKLQIANCRVPTSAICNLQFAICNLQFPLPHVLNPRPVTGIHDIPAEVGRCGGGRVVIPPGVDVPLTRRVRRLIDTARRFADWPRSANWAWLSLVYPAANHRDTQLGVFVAAIEYSTTWRLMNDSPPPFRRTMREVVLGRRAAARRWSLAVRPSKTSSCGTFLGTNSCVATAYPQRSGRCPRERGGN